MSAAHKQHMTDTSTHLVKNSCLAFFSTLRALHHAVVSMSIHSLTFFFT